jgi:hypothetical protein
VPDPIDVSQLFVEVGPETGSDEASQLIAEVLSTTGPDAVSQIIAEVAPTTGPDQLSQLIAEVAPTTGPDQISQVTIELLRGPEVVPPERSPTSTFTVGAGLGLDWFIALQLSDSGYELRDKVVKSVRVTGKVTQAKVKVYGYGPKEDINIEDIEDGTGQKCMVTLDDTQHVQQSRRFQINVKNAMVHTIRIEGRSSDTGIPDRIDEAVYEVARMGVRR